MHRLLLTILRTLHLQHHLAPQSRGRYVCPRRPLSIVLLGLSRKTLRLTLRGRTSLARLTNVLAPYLIHNPPSVFRSPPRKSRSARRQIPYPQESYLRVRRPLLGRDRHPVVHAHDLAPAPAWSIVPRAPRCMRVSMRVDQRCGG